MSTFVLKEYVVNRKRIGKGSFSTIYKGYIVLKQIKIMLLKK